MNLPSRKALQVFAFGKILSARKCFALHSALQDVAALGQWPWTQDPQLSFALLVTSEISFHVDVFWVGSMCSAASSTWTFLLARSFHGLGLAEP